MYQSPSSAGSQPVSAAPGQRRNAAFYAALVEAFLAASDEEAYAPLAAPRGYTLASEQLSACRLQVPLLRIALADDPALAVTSPAPWIYSDIDIPRLGRRVDAVLVTDIAVLPIEFKVGAKKFQQLGYEQACDYGLDLKNFHAPSHAAPIFPILCATEAPKSGRHWNPPRVDGVRPPFCCSGKGIRLTMRLSLDAAVATFAPLNPAVWNTRPFPPMHEASRRGMAISTNPRDVLVPFAAIRAAGKMWPASRRTANIEWNVL